MTVATLRQITGDFSSTLLPRVVSDGEPQALGAKLKAWWRADKGVTVDGSGKVSAWADQVGVYVLGQATAGARPAFLATGMAGGPAIQGDGVDDYLEAPQPVDGSGNSLWPSGTSEGWIWLVARGGDTDRLTHTLFGYGGHNPSSQRRAVRRSGTDYFNPYCGTSLLGAGFNLALNHVMGARFYNGGLNFNGRFDGVAVPGIGCSFNSTVERARAFAAVDSPVAGFSAAMIKHILITSALTADEINRLEVWGKWQANILL